MSTPLGYDPGSFYVWRASDDFAIHLSLQVVTQLNAQISRAANESQSGGLRGILLGRIVDTPFRATVIEDFKLLPPSEDPANLDADDALFELGCRMAEVGQEQRALGFFRSRRDGALNMGWRDLETFRLFCESGNVALLIQTSGRGNESDAALFYRQHGATHPRDFGFGFPLDAGQLANGHPGWRYPDPLRAPKPAAEALPEHKAAERTRPAPAPFSAAARERIRWSRLVPTAVLALVGIGAVQLAINSKQTVSAADRNQRGHRDLGLTVTPRQHQLEIRWNPQSAAIAASKNGVMKITEAGTTKAVPFDQDQLRDGFVAYMPTTSDVSIRLQVTGQDGGTTSESIRSLTSP